MFWSRVRNWWENVQGSLWFLPGVFAVAAVLLSLALPALDRRLSQEFTQNTGWLFGGDASAARSILSVLTGSLITVVSLVFSLTVVVLQQASTQFTPRLVLNFMSYKGNQLVLAAFIGTFLYGLLILRQVRGEGNVNGEFVPAVSVTAAILLATLCVGLLVFFIHHTAVSLQAAAVTKRVHEDLEHAVERLYPETLGSQVDEIDEDLESFKRRHQSQHSAVVPADHSGYLRVVSIDRIVEAAGAEAWVAIHPQIGWYVIRGMPLVEVGDVVGLTESQVDQLRSAFVLDAERSLHQDPLFGVRQLVDIALKALSPGINDPTTAEYAISHLGDVLAELAGRPFPSAVRVVDRPEGGGQLEVWVNRPTWDEFVDEAFSQIRREASDDVHVTRHLLNVIGAVGNCIQEPARARPLQLQIEEILAYVDASGFSPPERDVLRECAAAAAASLQAGARR